MIIEGNKKKRNLQEQVQKNKDDIENLQTGITNPEFANIQGDPMDNTPLKNALNSKVDKVTGKGLSTNDFTDPLKTKLEGIDMSSKQDALNTAQLAAVNSGVTSSDVSAIAALITQMLTKSPIIEAGLNITLETLPNGHIKISATGGAGGGIWGSITGSLSNQTDLWNQLQAKLNASAITAYRTANDQDDVDNLIVNSISNEHNRAVLAEQNLQTLINQCLKAANLVEGSNIDITVQGNNVIISCSIEGMEFKGSVPTYNDLPTSPQGGDTYSILGGTEANKIFTWKSATSQWVQSGSMFDQSLFYTKSQADALFATQTGTYSKSDADSTFIKNTGPQAIQGSLTVGNATGGLYASNEGIVISTVSTAQTVNVKYATDKIIKTTSIGGTPTVHEYTYPSDNGQLCTVEELNAESEAREQVDNTKQDKITSTNKLDFSYIGNTPTTLSGYGITDAYTKTESDNTFATKANTYTKTESDAKYVDADKTALTNQTKDTLFALVLNTNDTKVFYRVEFASSDAPPSGTQFLVEVHNTSTSSSEKYGYIIAKNRTSCYMADLNNNNWSDWKQIYSGVKDFGWTYLSIDTDNVSGGQWRICCKSGIVFIEAQAFTLKGHGTAGAVNNARIGLGIPAGYEPQGIEVRGVLSHNYGKELLQNCWISANTNELWSFKRQNQYTQCRLFISYPVF